MRWYHTTSCRRNRQASSLPAPVSRQSAEPVALVTLQDSENSVSLGDWIS